MFLNAFIAPDFWYSLENQVPALMNDMFGDAVKEVQLYDDYGLRSGHYPFFDDTHYYYPLSVIFKKYFLTHGTYVFGTTTGDANADIEAALCRKLNCTVEFAASWPDVTCELQFSKVPNMAVVSALFATYVASYSQRHTPLHYVSDPIQSGTTVQIHIDFGDADPKALDVLATTIKKAKWQLDKICFY